MGLLAYREDQYEEFILRFRELTGMYLKYKSNNYCVLLPFQYNQLKKKRNRIFFLIFFFSFFSFFYRDRFRRRARVVVGSVWCVSVPLPPSGTCVRCVSRFRWDEFFFCCHRLTTISVCVALAWRVKVRFFFYLFVCSEMGLCVALSRCCDEYVVGLVFVRVSLTPMCVQQGHSC